MRVCPERFNWREKTHPECEKPHLTEKPLQLNKNGKASKHQHASLSASWPWVQWDQLPPAPCFQHHNRSTVTPKCESKQASLPWVASVSGTAAMRKITNRAVTFTRLALLCPWLRHGVHTECTPTSRNAAYALLGTSEWHLDPLISPYPSDSRTLPFREHKSQEVSTLVTS